MKRSMFLRAAAAFAHSRFLLVVLTCVSSMAFTNVLEKIPPLEDCPAHRLPEGSMLGQNPPRVLRDGEVSLCFAVIEDPRRSTPRRLLRPRPVLMLTEDGTLYWNVQVFRLGSAPGVDSPNKPWLQDYYVHQLTREELEEFLAFCEDIGVFAYIGKGYGVASHMPFSRIYVQEGDSLTTLWTGHTGWRAREFRGVNFRGEIPEGVSLEEILAGEPPEQQRFMHLWDSFYAKLTGYIPPDQSTWEVATDFEYIYESCTREQLDDAANRRAAFELTPVEDRGGMGAGPRGGG